MEHYISETVQDRS